MAFINGKEVLFQSHIHINRDAKVYSNVDSYNVGDIVLYKEKYYTPLNNATVGIEPTDTAYWQSINELSADLARTRKAIIGRGGEIPLNSGLKDFPEAIYNIPADASLAYQTDESSAYRKIVPEGAEKYAQIGRIGGMTYKTKNLMVYPYQHTTRTHNGIAYTDNGDGTITANGTADGNSYFEFCYTWGKCYLPSGDYYFSGCASGGSSSSYYINIAFKNADGETIFDNFDTGAGRAISLTETAVKIYCRLIISSGTTITNLVFKPMLNSGASTLPFEQYYEGLRNSKVSSLTSNGTSGETISTLDIPETVKSKDGYGEGVNNTYYDYLEWRNGRCYFVRTCTKLVFDGTEGWYTGSFGKESQFFALEKIPLGISTTAGLMNGYDKTTIGSSTTSVGWHLLIQANPILRIRPTNVLTDFPTLADWKAHLAERYQNGNPLEFVYALAEPVEEDITDLITSDNFIEVEGGGSIEFVNEYEHSVPSTVNYIVKVGT